MSYVIKKFLEMALLNSRRKQIRLTEENSAGLNHLLHLSLQPVPETQIIFLKLELGKYWTQKFLSGQRETKMEVRSLQLYL